MPIAANTAAPTSAPRRPTKNAATNDAPCAGATVRCGTVQMRQSFLPCSTCEVPLVIIWPQRAHGPSPVTGGASRTGTGADECDEGSTGVFLVTSGLSQEAGRARVA